ALPISCSVARAWARSGWTSVMDAGAPSATPFQVLDVAAPVPARAIAGRPASVPAAAAMARKRRRELMAGTSVPVAGLAVIRMAWRTLVRMAMLAMVRMVARAAPGVDHSHRAEDVVVRDVGEPQDAPAVLPDVGLGGRLFGEGHGLGRAHAAHPVALDHQQGILEPYPGAFLRLVPLARAPHVVDVDRGDVASLLRQAQEGDGVAHRSEPDRRVAAREMDLSLGTRVLRQAHPAVVTRRLEGCLGGRRRGGRGRVALARRQAEPHERRHEDGCDETRDSQADLL